MSGLAHSQMTKSRIEEIDSDIACITDHLQALYNSGGNRIRILEMHREIDTLLDERAMIAPLV